MKNIQCVECKAVIGTIDLLPLDPINRPGMLSSVCEPHPMPTACPFCKGALTRVTLEGV